MPLQCPDGGWPYHAGGPAWTEPTAYSLLVLMEPRPAAEPAARALHWLRAMQRPDGGWPPEASVAQSTWVTAAVALLGPVLLGKPCYDRAIAWVVRQSGQENNFLMRVRQFLAGQPAPPAPPGWPWYPSTSAWVTPTALSVLALRKACHTRPSAAIAERVEMGVEYLLARTCSDGGWNYGTPRALGYDAPSYPETTGAALLALAGRRSDRIERACGWARSHLDDCQSSEEQSWLRLGLSAHGELPAVPAGCARPPRTVQNMALALLADAAEQGRNPFLDLSA